jgi:hypothetical protein
LAEGLVEDPPVPWSMLGTAGGLPYLKRDCLGEERDEDTDRKWWALYEKLCDWREASCQHWGMEICSARVGSWPEVSVFRSYVSRFDDGQLSTLRNLLPHRNSGSVSPEQASAVLSELDLLCERAVGCPGWFLVDADTGEEEYDYNPRWGGNWAFSHGGISCGFDPAGIFVRKDDVEVFRSMAVQQRVKYEDDRDVVTFIGDDGSQFTFDGMGFGRDDLDLKVVARPLVQDDIPCVKPLRELFQASIETDTPVYWC